MAEVKTARAAQRFSHVLVPLDGSRLAEAVLPAAWELARRFGAKLTLLHVMEQGAPSSVHGESHLSDVAEAGRYLATLAEGLSDRGVTVDYHVHPNQERNVAASIVQHAGELVNDLVVLAAHGSGGLRDVVMGSIAAQVVGRGSFPVLLIRPEAGVAEAAFEPRVLLVPLDGTPDSEQAVPLAEVVARAFDAEIRLLRIVPTTSSLRSEQAAVATILPGATRAALDAEETVAEEYLRGLTAGLQERGVAAAALVIRGDPRALIADVARAEGADLVVLTTHGKAGLDAFWSGSVGDRLLRRFTVPMLVLRSKASA
jgi:nucleotide-binding universal stress UspA family protein